MYGIHQKTIPAKLFILTVQLIYLLIDFKLLQGNNAINSLVTASITVFLIITFLRLNSMMFIWIPRGISWSEAIGNSLAFGIYYIGFPLLALRVSHFSLSILIFGYLFFVLGSLINTSSELLRKPFKDNPANKGKLYTGGLFKYSMHINYFGDILWVLGFALVTMNPWSLIIPMLLIALFVFSYIPNADRYLANKYGKQFEDYQKSTKKLIPFIW